MKALIDRHLSKLISRKLSVFIIASVFVYLEKISSEGWVEIAVVYIGSQAAIDAVKALRNA